MRKFILIIMCVAFATVTASSQSKDAAIHALAQSLRSHKNIEASFTYQTISDAAQPEESKEGKAYFQDTAYKILMDDQHVVSDGTTTWHYIIEDEEVMVGNAKEDDSPFKMLDQLEKDSSSLKPVIDSKGNLKSLEIELDEGLTVRLSITEMKFDQDYPEDFFTFDTKAHPDVDIIDMR